MIFRIPVDNQHFKDTIENGKSIQEIEKFISSEEKLRLERASKDGVLRYWGSIPGESGRRNFESLKEGDEVLFYRSGKYIALGTIAYKIINAQLAKYSWGETDLGRTWELIYFFKDLLFFQIESSQINQEFGYKNGPVMGFNAISADKNKEFVSRNQSVRNLITKLNLTQRSTEEKIDEIVKTPINSPFEAQFYLIELGNTLEYNTYVPSSDAGHQVFDKKLDDLITVRASELSDYVAPALLDPLSHIDVIWFKDSFRPKYFFEVIHKTGWSEAFLRLDLVGKNYDSAKTRIVGPKRNEDEFQNAIRRWSGPKDNIAFKSYDELVKVHSESFIFKELTSEFLK